MANKMPDFEVATEPSDVRVIHKYPIPMGNSDLWLAKSSIILDIAGQYGEVFMWVERPADDVVCEVRSFEVFGTGHPIPPKARKFLKTLHHSSGLVLHYYEVV